MHKCILPQQTLKQRWTLFSSHKVVNVFHETTVTSVKPQLNRLKHRLHIRKKRPFLMNGFPREFIFEDLWQMILPKTFWSSLAFLVILLGWMLAHCSQLSVIGRLLVNSSGGSGPGFIGFRLARRPWFRVRVHRVSNLD